VGTEKRGLYRIHNGVVDHYGRQMVCRAIKSPVFTRITREIYG
jgi:hypothetical protein